MYSNSEVCEDYHTFQYLEQATENINNLCKDLWYDVSLLLEGIIPPLNRSDRVQYVETRRGAVYNLVMKTGQNEEDFRKSQQGLYDDRLQQKIDNWSLFIHE